MEPKNPVNSQKLKAGGVKKTPPADSLSLVDQVAQAVNKALEKTSRDVRLSVLGDPGAYPEIHFRFPLGVPGLEAAMGTGGFPLCKLIELFGPESSGKSTLSKFIAAQAQKSGVIPIVVDAEQSGDMEYDRLYGFDPKRALGGQVDYLEDAFLLLASGVKILKSMKLPGLAILDSVAAAPLKAEAERAFDEKGRMAERAAFLSKAVPRLVSLVRDSKIGILFVIRSGTTRGLFRFRLRPTLRGDMLCAISATCA